MASTTTHRARASLVTRVALTGFAAVSAVLIGLAANGALEPLRVLVPMRSAS